MHAIRKWILFNLLLFNHIRMAALNKGIHDCSLQNMRIFFLMPICFFVSLPGRVFMHGIWYIKHACAAVYTEFVALGILFRIAVPTMLIALMIDNLVNMLLRTFTKNLRDFIAI